MRSRAEVAFVLELVRAGWNDCEIARETAIPRRTIRDWRTGRTPDFDRLRTRPSPNARSCAVCRGDPLSLPQSAYTYLLGLYLGDGCIATHPREVFRLRIVCADAYPELIQRCETAMAEVLPNKVSRTPKIGCTEVAAYSKHWPCLFPQHGPGHKHERRIELAPWQQDLIDQDPRPLLRGLLHSDGCRVLKLGERDALPALPLQQCVGGHPRDLRAGVRSTGDRVAAEQPLEPVGGQAGECRPAGRVRGAEAMRPGGDSDDAWGISARWRPRRRVGQQPAGPGGS